MYCQLFLKLYNCYMLCMKRAKELARMRQRCSQVKINMNRIDYSAFAWESFKISLFCLSIVGLFKLFGATDKSLLILFNMAVMSVAATFSVHKKQINHISLGSSVVVFSTVLGGVIGFYYPWLASVITIIYTGLAFYLPKSTSKANVFITGSLAFLIFSALPFSLQSGIKYALAGAVVIAVFTLFYWLFEYRKNANDTKPEPTQANSHMALVSILSLALAWIISHYLNLYSSLSHLYWIGLTILLIIQGSQQKTIYTAIKRIGVNTFGAIIVVFLFGYIVPQNFWINFILLVIFLFLIFFLGFSYFFRVFFIELFVFGFAHLLGDYHNVFALDRIILTCIGGMIVITVTLMLYWIKPEV